MRFMTETWRRAFLTALVLALIGVLPAAGKAQLAGGETKTVTVFAAASLKNALDAAVAEYQKSTGTKVLSSYAATSALAKQIEQGAPADVFISADLDWMDYLAGKALIRNDTRVNLLGNRLVLIAPASSNISLKIEPGFALAAALGEGRLAVGDVKAVPAGKYAKASLEALGIWPVVEPRLAQAENVRAALALVARGEAPLGIVYQTDAASDPNVKIVGEFPANTHPPIIYPVAVTKAANAPDTAKALIDYLRSAQAAEVFTKQGFIVLK